MKKPKRLKVIYDGKVIWDADVVDCFYSQQRQVIHAEVRALQKTVAVSYHRLKPSGFSGLITWVIKVLEVAND